MESGITKAGWKSAIMEHGALCVMITQMIIWLLLCADN